MVSIVGIIPARGGSKGIPRKNIRQMAGFPLLYWTIQAAAQSQKLSDFFVSTEDPEIADIAKGYGAKIIDRPMTLAQDDSTTLEVLQHTIKKVECDAVMVLQPTSPLRNYSTIDECIGEYQAGGWDTLATGYIPKIIEYGTHQNLRRQDIQGFFYDDGNVYIVDRSVLVQGRWFGDRIFRKELTKELNFEIDDDIDCFICECLLKKRLREGTQPWDLHAKLRGVQMLVMDTDGVLTDAGMYYSETGDEIKRFNTRDGKGIEILRNLGVKTAIITGEKTALVERRAMKLGIDHLIQGVQEKGPSLRSLAISEEVDIAAVAYIGDDLNDLEPMKLSGIPVAVRDANPKVRDAALFCTELEGGRGAVRELCDMISAAKNSSC
jgi:YrbI family 3-deoxy-D-manno-octulosonate 8-phosphate phosphatase